MRSAAALAVFGIVTTLLGAATPQQEDVVVALHAGEPLTLHVQRGKGGSAVNVGPWRLGTRVKNVARGRADRISDTRINLYFIVPGNQHRSAVAEFDHNLIVNIAADEGQPLEKEADLFWVAVLDPRVTLEIRLENDLIMLAQERFTPNDLYAIDDAPGWALLREQLHFESLRDLAKYRNDDGTLPRVLIVPANIILHVIIDPQPAPAPAAEAKPQ